jgi:hypothetical protein
LLYEYRIHLHTLLEQPIHGGLKGEVKKPVINPSVVHVPRNPSEAVSYYPEFEERDLSQIPNQLDRLLEQQDSSNSVRPSIINVGAKWKQMRKQSLVSDYTQYSLEEHSLESAKNSAFDLLDSLTRSGELPLHDASLHTIVGVSHLFDKTLLETLIQDNINPIETLTRSMSLLSSVIYNVPTNSYQ